MHKTIGKTILSSCTIRSPYSYELCGNLLITRLFGFLPVFSIHLSNIHYLRLATRDEVNPVYLLVNWSQFLSYQRAASPLYVLQAKTGRRLFLKLNGKAHFKLRQAIGRQLEQKLRQPKRMAA